MGGHGYAAYLGPGDSGRGGVTGERRLRHQHAVTGTQQGQGGQQHHLVGAVAHGDHVRRRREVLGGGHAAARDSLSG